MRSSPNRKAAALLVLLALFTAQLVMHMNCDNLLLDDWVFEAVLSQGESPTAYLQTRYMTWSSRLIIEAALILITHSIWAFRVLDSLMMVLMCYGLCRLAACERRPGMLALGACLVSTIPFAVLRSTGWMATSLNYYWPLACSSFALIPLADTLWKRETGRLLQTLAVLLALYAANQEQTAALLVGASLVFGAALLLRDGRMPSAAVAVGVIALAELALHLICPGNAVRAQQSVAMVNLRDYVQFSLIDKLSIGLTSTASLLLYTFNPVLLATGAVTAGTLLSRRRGSAAQIPVLLLLLCQLMALLPAEAMNGLLAPFAQYRRYVLQLGPQYITSAAMQAMMAGTVVLLGLMALTLYVSLGHRPAAAACVLVFALGFAARMALSFSPTVVESGERTMLPLYGAMMLCALLCARESGKDGARRLPQALGLGICLWLAAANVIGSFALAA